MRRRSREEEKREQGERGGREEGTEREQGGREEGAGRREEGTGWKGGRNREKRGGYFKHNRHIQKMGGDSFTIERASVFALNACSHAPLVGR